MTEVELGLTSLSYSLSLLIKETIVDNGGGGL